MIASNYEQDLSAAVEMVVKQVDFSGADGNMRSWVQDALNDSWDEALTVEQWIAPIITRFAD